MYWLRFVLHDWSDPYASKILKRLRAAAGSKSTLVVEDGVQEFACPNPPKISAMHGNAPIPAPAPLLSNYGTAKGLNYHLDFVVSGCISRKNPRALITDLVQMLALFNAHERTMTMWEKLLTEAGWKVERVYPAAPGGTTKIVTSPV